MATTVDGEDTSSDQENNKQSLVNFSNKNDNNLDNGSNPKTVASSENVLVQRNTITRKDSIKS